jgi:hypothetical protein
MAPEGRAFWPIAVGLGILLIAATSAHGQPRIITNCNSLGCTSCAAQTCTGPGSSQCAPLTNLLHCSHASTPDCGALSESEASGNCNGQAGYDCGPGTCGAGQSCQVKLDASGNRIQGTACGSSNCVTTPVPGSSPMTFARSCSGSGGPAGETSQPPRGRGGGAGAGRGGAHGSGDGQKGGDQGQTCAVGGSGHVGDPVSLSDGTSVLVLQDVTVPSTVWPINFTRTPLWQRE